MVCSLASDSRVPPSGRAGVWLNCLCRSTLSVVRELESPSWEEIRSFSNLHHNHLNVNTRQPTFTYQHVNSLHQSMSTCHSCGFWARTVSPALLLRVSMCPANHLGWFSTEPCLMTPPVAGPPCSQTFARSPVGAQVLAFGLELLKLREVWGERLPGNTESFGIQNQRGMQPSDLSHHPDQTQHSH